MGCQNSNITALLGEAALFIYSSVHLFIYLSQVSEWGTKKGDEKNTARIGQVLGGLIYIYIYIYIIYIYILYVMY